MQTSAAVGGETPGFLTEVPGPPPNLIPARSNPAARLKRPLQSAFARAALNRSSRGSCPPFAVTGRVWFRYPPSSCRDIPTADTPAREGSARPLTAVVRDLGQRLPYHTTGCPSPSVHARFQAGQRQCFAGFPPVSCGCRRPSPVEAASGEDYSRFVGRREIGAQLEPGIACGGGGAGRRSSGPRSQRIPTPDPSVLRRDSV